MGEKVQFADHSLDVEALMSDVTQTGFENLLNEERTFPPIPEFAEEAIVRDRALYELAAKDPVAYWEKEAKELEWFKPWERTLDWTPPHVRWFDGGKINITYNCLDRHLNGPRRNKAAIIWEGENGEVKTYTYGQLDREVRQFANCLKGLGVEKGDRIAIYMPMLPEAAIAMLACARIGAIHSVVFGGFSPDSLADRINDAQCKSVEGWLAPRSGHHPQAQLGSRARAMPER